MRNPFRKRKQVREFDGPAEFRLIYAESGDLYAVDPSNARWKCKPGVVLRVHNARNFTMNETAGELIEDGPDD